MTDKNLLTIASFLAKHDLYKEASQIKKLAQQDPSEQLRTEKELIVEQNLSRAEMIHAIQDYLGSLTDSQISNIHEVISGEEHISDEDWVQHSQDFNKFLDAIEEDSSLPEPEQDSDLPF